MPGNEDFALEILVGGDVLQEYETESTAGGTVYVESNLSTPVSYRRSVTELVGTELESQEVPVTPYEIRVTAREYTPRLYYRIFVDGVKVKSTSLSGGQTRVIKGFKDGASIREFLFSLPRFSRDEDDRIKGERCAAVGKVEVECWIATLVKSSVKLRKQPLGFHQATKKDCYSVTKGQYTMATSTVGQAVATRNVFRNVDHWKRSVLKSKLAIQYHMGHTLQAMGFTLRPTTVPTTPEKPSVGSPTPEKPSVGSPASTSRKLSKFCRRSPRLYSEELLEMKQQSHRGKGKRRSRIPPNNASQQGALSTLRTANLLSDVVNEIKEEPNTGLGQTSPECVKVRRNFLDCSDVVDLTCDSDDNSSKADMISQDSGIELTPAL